MSNTTKPLKDAVKEAISKMVVSGLLAALALVCVGAIWHLAVFAIGAPNSAIAKFAIGAAFALAVIGGFCIYGSIKIWSAP